jgi:hypothetical protein
MDISMTLDLPVSAPLSSTVRALEAARDVQTGPEVKQALAMATALASGGLMETLARSLKPMRDKADQPTAQRQLREMTGVALNNAQARTFRPWSVRRRHPKRFPWRNGRTGGGTWLGTRGLTFQLYLS